jgi:hypothetical protein
MKTGSAPDSGIVVYSTASYPPHPGFIIYTIIAGALEFARSKGPGTVERVEIRLMPMGIRDHLRQAGRAAWEAVSKPRAQATAALAATGRLRGLRLGRLTLWTSRYPVGATFLVDALKSVAAAWGLWKSSFPGQSFSATRFLDLSYGGVQIGDLAASEALRVGRGQIAALEPGFDLFAMLVDAVLICRTCERIPAAPNAAVLTLEPTYRHAVYKRALRARGLTVIEPKMYDSASFVFIAPDEELRNPHIARPSERPLTADDRLRVDEYMRERLADPRKHLPYMVDGFNDNQSMTLRSLDGGVVVVDPSKVHVALFLHSFDDAQYYFGLDGFGDLCEWTDLTIQSCLQNADIGSVLVKVHPNMTAHTHAKNARTEAWLRHRYASQERVVWLERNASLRAVANLGRVIGITHHGSIAEELVFLGVPVIGYKGAQWRDGYVFVRTWSDPAEYRTQLAAISVDGHHAVTPEEAESFRRFVFESRLNPNAGDIDNLAFYRRWLAARGRDPQGTDDEALQDRLSSLSPEEAVDFLGFLLASPA